MARGWSLASATAVLAVLSSEWPCAAGQKPVDCSAYEAKPELTWLEDECRDTLSKEVLHCVEIAELALAERARRAADNPLAAAAAVEEVHASNHDGANYDTVFVIFAAFAVGSILRHLTKDSSIPYTCTVFVVGLAMGGLGKVFDDTRFSRYVEIADMDPHLILHAFLPVLIFESAFAMQISVFKKVVFQCLILAVFGLLLASYLTSLVAQWLFDKYGWDFTASFLFGTILSATDPVAVVALLKDLGASPIISTLIEGESLFNDGTAIVIFSVFKEGVLKQNCEPVDWTACTFSYASAACECEAYECTVPKSLVEMFIAFLKTSLGGCAVGAIIGAIAIYSLEKVHNDALTEITITLVTAYVTFFTAEGWLEVSGVLGVVTCGLMVSYFHHSISAEVEHTMHEFWETIVYLTNTLIFLLAGVIVAMRAFRGIDETDFIDLFVIYVALNIVRALVLAVFIKVLNLFPAKLGLGECCLVAWGGLRGAVGLALALVIQQDNEVVSPLIREKFVFHTSGIVMLTLLVNGITTKMIVQYFNLDAVSDRSKRAMHRCWEELLIEVDESVRDLRNTLVYYDTNWERLHKQVDLSSLLPSTHRDPYNRKGEQLAYELTPEEELQETRQLYLSAVAGSVNQQYHAGTLETKEARTINRLIEKLQGRDMDPKRLVIEPSDLGKIFATTSKRPREDRSGIVQWWKNRLYASRAREAFCMSIALAECHQLVEERAKVLAPEERTRIIQMARQSTYAITTQATAAVQNQEDIAIMTKTKYAARIILNSMEQKISAIKSLDETDKAVLRQCISERTKKLSASADHCKKASAAEVLMDTSWYQCAGERMREELLDLLRKRRMVEVEVPQGARLADPRDRDSARATGSLGGLMLVLSGIVTIRMGYYQQQYGAGQFLGLMEFIMPKLRGGTLFSMCFAETKCTVLYIPRDLVNTLCLKAEFLQKELWRLAGVHAAQLLLPRMGERWRPPVCEAQQLARMVRGGQVEVIQDPEAVRGSRRDRVILPTGCQVLLLRGSCWEYDLTGHDGRVTRTHLKRAPAVLPATFKFATFTGHAVIFVIPLPSGASDRARRRWGALRGKVRAINLWVGLRGAHHRRDALAIAMGRTPRQGNLDASYYHKASSEIDTKAKLAFKRDRKPLLSASNIRKPRRAMSGGQSVFDGPSSFNGSMTDLGASTVRLSIPNVHAGSPTRKRAAIADFPSDPLGAGLPRRSSFTARSATSVEESSSPVLPPRTIPSQILRRPRERDRDPLEMSTTSTAFTTHNHRERDRDRHASPRSERLEPPQHHPSTASDAGNVHLSDQLVHLQKENALLRAELIKGLKGGGDSPRRVAGMATNTAVSPLLLGGGHSPHGAVASPVQRPSVLAGVGAASPVHSVHSERGPGWLLQGLGSPVGGQAPPHVLQQQQQDAAAYSAMGSPVSSARPSLLYAQGSPVGGGGAPVHMQAGQGYYPAPGYQQVYQPPQHPQPVFLIPPDASPMATMVGGGGPGSDPSPIGSPAFPSPRIARAGYPDPLAASMSMSLSTGAASPPAAQMPFPQQPQASPIAQRVNPLLAHCQVPAPSQAPQVQQPSPPVVGSPQQHPSPDATMPVAVPPFMVHTITSPEASEAASSPPQASPRGGSPPPPAGAVQDPQNLNLSLSIGRSPSHTPSAVSAPPANPSPKPDPKAPLSDEHYSALKAKYLSKKG